MPVISNAQLLYPDIQIHFAVCNISINRAGSSLILAGPSGLCVMYLYERMSTKDNIITCRYIYVQSYFCKCCSNLYQQLHMFHQIWLFLHFISYFQDKIQEFCSQTFGVSILLLCFEVTVLNDEQQGNCSDVQKLVVQGSMVSWDSGYSQVQKMEYFYVFLLFSLDSFLTFCRKGCWLLVVKSVNLCYYRGFLLCALVQQTLLYFNLNFQIIYMIFGKFDWEIEADLEQFHSQFQFQFDYSLNVPISIEIR